MEFVAEGKVWWKRYTIDNQTHDFCRFQLELIGHLQRKTVS